MKTKLLLVASLLMICGALSAQTSMRHCKGYSGNVSVGCHVPLNDFGSQGQVLMHHGYALGNGSFVGVGAGLMMNLWGQGQIPLFLKLSHTFDAGSLNPYIAASVGVIGNEYLSFSHYVTPEVGVMLGRWFFYTQFSYYRYTDNVDPGTDIYRFTKYPALSFGIGLSW